MVVLPADVVVCVSVSHVIKHRRRRFRREKRGRNRVMWFITQLFYVYTRVLNKTYHIVNRLN